MSEERLVEIETKIAFQEQTIKDLNDVVYKQQKELERLAGICTTLEKHNKETLESTQGVDALANEKPPHY